MNGHNYDKDGVCIKCGLKKDDFFYPAGAECPYDDWANGGYTEEEPDEGADE